VLTSELLVGDMICRHLKRKGMSLARSMNNEEAQGMINEAGRAGNPYDLVIADIFTPRVDGISFFRWLVNNHSTLPVLILCGYGTLDVTLHLLRPKMDGFCRKPLTPEAVWSAVQKIKSDNPPQSSTALAESIL